MGRPRKNPVSKENMVENNNNPVYKEADNSGHNPICDVVSALDSAEIVVEAPIIITSPTDNSVNTTMVGAESTPTPRRIDPEWNDYVMSHFVDDELIDGKPNASGLRRVFEKLIGIVTAVDVNVIQPPNPENDNHAVVSTQLTYFSLQNGLGTIRVSDAADVFIGNTAEPFYRHPVATAATIAESRCYRKELRLRTISSEENQAPKGEQAEIQKIMESAPQLATPIQKNTIEKLCKVVGIKNVDKLLAVVLGAEPIKTMGSISEEEGKKVLRMLNKYQTGPKKGGEVVPEELFQ